MSTFNPGELFWTQPSQFFWSIYNPENRDTVNFALCRDYLKKMEYYKNKDFEKFKSIVKGRKISPSHPFLQSKSNSGLADLRDLSLTFSFSSKVNYKIEKIETFRQSGQIIKFVSFYPDLVAKTSPHLVNKISESLLKQIFYSFCDISVDCSNYSENISLLPSDLVPAIEKAFTKRLLLQERSQGSSRRNSVKNHLIVSLVKLCTAKRSPQELETLEEWIRYYSNADIQLCNGAKYFDMIKKYHLKISRYFYDFTVKNEKFSCFVDLMINDDEVVEIKWDLEPPNFSHLAVAASMFFPEYKISKLTVINFCTGCVTRAKISPMSQDELLPLINLRTLEESLEVQIGEESCDKEPKYPTNIITINQSIKITEAPKIDFEEEMRKSKEEYEENYFVNREKNGMCAEITMILLSGSIFVLGMVMTNWQYV